MLCDARKIMVGGEHGQVMAQAQLRQQRIDGSDLHARSPALVAQACGPDMVFAIRCDERQRGKPLHDPIA